MVLATLVPRRLAWFVPILLSLAIAPGCTSSYELTYPEPRPLGPVLPSVVTATDEGEMFGEEVGPFDSTANAGSLTLDEAVALAIAKSPALCSAAFEVRAREGEVYQAARAPNPELEVGALEFGGAGGRSGFGGAEFDSGVSQEIELGGDRRARAAVAARNTELGAWNLEAARLDLVTQVHQAFTTVLAAETRLGLAEEQYDIARRFSDTVARRAEAGAVSLLEARRAVIAAATTRAVASRTERAARAARTRLGLLVGIQEDSLVVVGELFVLDRIPPYDVLRPLLARNPAAARYQTELGHAEAKVDLERALRIPNLSVRAGVSYFNEVDESAFSAGISIPLPLFNTNRGAVEAARARVRRTVFDAEAVQINLERELTEAYETLAAAAEAARTLRDEALPNAELAYSGVQVGYREGEFDLLAVLDAQRTLVETQNAVADALADAAQARVAVERLIATSLNTLTD